MRNITGLPSAVPPNTCGARVEGDNRFGGIEGGRIHQIWLAVGQRHSRKAHRRGGSPQIAPIVLYLSVDPTRNTENQIAVGVWLGPYGHGPVVFGAREMMALGHAAIGARPSFRHTGASANSLT
jgi:hypothetical protein